MLGLVENVGVAHNTSEDPAVGEEGAFRDSDAPPDHLAVLHPLVEPAHKGVDLEGEAPASLVLVVQLKEIDVLLLANVLPVGEGFVQDGQLRKVLPDYLQNR